MADEAARGAGDGRGPNRVVLGLVFAFPFLIAGALVAWNHFSVGPCTTLEEVRPAQKVFERPPCEMTSDDFLYIAEFDTSAGPLRLALDPILAPRTVNNLVFLVRAGFYDGMRIHKIEVTEDHAFVQIGDPTGTGRGTPGYTFHADQVSPIARYTRGRAAMVFAGDDPSTAGSQFFIVIEDYEALSYPARQPINTLFGGVIDPESLRTLDVIGATPRSPDGRPLDDIIITSATITEQRRFGADDEE